jgi:hypothetical protein
MQFIGGRGEDSPAGGASGGRPEPQGKPSEAGPAEIEDDDIPF